MPKQLTIGTRASELAVAQAEYVRGLLLEMEPRLKVHLKRISTKGDRILDAPLAKVGGKGLFVKEIEDALIKVDVDMAVHSMKDMPAVLPVPLIISIIPEREEARDAFVSNTYKSLEELPEGAVVGTSSLRRKAQLLALRPDLTVRDLRGNVGTRLAKLDAGEFDAVILAAAGLKRLGLAERITALIPLEQMVPAVGQGALAVEIRRDNDQLSQVLQQIDHPETAFAVMAERAFLARLEGGCQVPIGGHAVFDETELHVTLTGLIASLDGKTVLKETRTAPAAKAVQMGAELAESLLAQGGRNILNEVYRDGVPLASS